MINYKVYFFRFWIVKILNEIKNADIKIWFVSRPLNIIHLGGGIVFLLRLSLFGVDPYCLSSIYISGYYSRVHEGIIIFAILQKVYAIAFY